MGLELTEALAALLQSFWSRQSDTEISRAVLPKIEQCPRLWEGFMELPRLGC